eukprot:5142150-Prymnesium_polylepis.1
MAVFPPLLPSYRSKSAFFSLSVSTRPLPLPARHSGLGNALLDVSRQGLRELPTPAHQRANDERCEARCAGGRVLRARRQVLSGRQRCMVCTVVGIVRMVVRCGLGAWRG